MAYTAVRYAIVNGKYLEVEKGKDLLCSLLGKSLYTGITLRGNDIRTSTSTRNLYNVGHHNTIYHLRVATGRVAAQPSLSTRGR